jgi:hypothetical protein
MALWRGEGPTSAFGLKAFDRSRPIADVFEEGWLVEIEAVAAA